jgi:hypothetical protein
MRGFNRQAPPRAKEIISRAEKKPLLNGVTRAE